MGTAAVEGSGIGVKSELIYAIDPGPEQSGVVALMDGGIVLTAFNLTNEALIATLHEHKPDTTVAIEMIASYGMAVGQEVFDTCRIIGRIEQEWYRLTGKYPTLVYRKDVKLHLCQSLRAKDANIRQALIDRVGPVGRKKTPGPCYHIKSHMWSALAVAVYTHDKLRGVQ